MQDNLCVRASFLCIPILFQLQNHSVINTNINIRATCLHDLQTTQTTFKHDADNVSTFGYSLRSVFLGKREC